MNEIKERKKKNPSNKKREQEQLSSQSNNFLALSLIQSAVFVSNRIKTEIPHGNLRIETSNKRAQKEILQHKVEK
jgi:hypothetical protein